MTPTAIAPARGVTNSVRPPRSGYVDPEHPGSKTMRVRIETVNRVADLARAESRPWNTQLDVVVNAGLKALGLPPLATVEPTPADDPQPQPETGRAPAPPKPKEPERTVALAPSPGPPAATFTEPKTPA